MGTALLFGSFAVFILIGVPIGYAIGAATLITMVLVTDIPLVTIVQQSVTGVDSFPLMAIPFFMLAGNLMSNGGVARRIINFCNHLVGAITGGLSLVTTAACMFFAAISGSAVATTSAIGSFMIPEMEKEGYERSFSASIAAAAGSIGVIIPPSIPFVIYAVTVNCSTGDLFIAGIIPGILMGVALMVVCYIIARRKNYRGSGKGISFKGMRQAFKIIRADKSSRPAGRDALRQAWKQAQMGKSFRELGKAFVNAFWALLTPVIILGGIYSGIFTPTEAAVIAVVYCVFISVVVYREITWKDIYKSLFSTTIINGITTFMVGLSMGFAAYLNLQQVPASLAELFLSITSSKVGLLLLINLFLLILGCLIDNIPATIILSPILLPLVTSFGMDPVTFGVVLTMNLAIGFVTPPYGINLFVAQSIAEIKMGQMMRPMLAFIGALIVVLLLTTFVPWLTMGFLD